MDVTSLWWLSIAIFAVVIVVVAVLLGLIIATARRIDTHAAAIWNVGKQIAGNTVAIWMLDRANRQLGEVLGAVKALGATSASMDQTLRGLARGGRA